MSRTDFSLTEANELRYNKLLFEQLTEEQKEHVEYLCDVIDAEEEDRNREIYESELNDIYSDNYYD